MKRFLNRESDFAKATTDKWHESTRMEGTKTGADRLAWPTEVSAPEKSFSQKETKVGD